MTAVRSLLWLIATLPLSVACKSGTDASSAKSKSSDASATSTGEPCENWIAGSEARQIVANGGLLLDVRTPEEYSQGHLDGSTNINVEELESRVSEIPEGKQVVVYCRSGKRAHRAAEILKSHGFQVSEIGQMSQYEPDAPAGCHE